MKKLAQREPIRIPYLAFQLCNLEKKKNRVPYTTPGSKVSIVKWEKKPRHSSPSEATEHRGLAGVSPVRFGGKVG